RERSSLPAGALLGQGGLDLPEGRVLGGDHVEHDRLLRALHPVQLADEVLERLDADAEASARLRDSRVVAAAELRGDEAAAAPALTVLHPAEHAVVEHD